MAPKKNRVKKRVRIQSGHEARYIPNRKSMKKYKQKRSRVNRVQKAVRYSKLGRSRTHRPTVAELVYQFLEKASNQGTCRSQKTNATYQFRKGHRSKRLRPNAIRRRTDSPGNQLYSEQLETDMEQIMSDEKNIADRNNCQTDKSVFEILSLGAMLGYLTPTDKTGTSFRVSLDYDADCVEPQEEQETITIKEAPSYFDDDDDEELETTW